jgi:hypothetical protein
LEPAGTLTGDSSAPALPFAPNKKVGSRPLKIASGFRPLKYSQPLLQMQAVEGVPGKDLKSSFQR